MTLSFRCLLFGISWPSKKHKLNSRCLHFNSSLQFSERYVSLPSAFFLFTVCDNACLRLGNEPFWWEQTVMAISTRLKDVGKNVPLGLGVVRHRKDALRVF